MKIHENPKRTDHDNSSSESKDPREAYYSKMEPPLKKQKVSEEPAQVLSKGLLTNLKA